MIKDITNQRFTRLIALHLLRKNGRIYWHCRCDCGNECDVDGAELRRGGVRSCGCLAVEALKRKRSDSNDVAINRIYDRYKVQAKLRNIDFALTKEEFKSLIKCDCYYCGSKPLNTFNSYMTKALHPPFRYNGIDRIDSDSGYTSTNCVPCCSICNFAKNDLTVEQFRDWLRQVYKHQFTKVAEKTPAVMMDELFTVNMKLWFEQEKLLVSPKGSGEADEHAKKAQELNAKRNRLIRGLDGLLDFSEGTLTEKSYAK